MNRIGVPWLSSGVVCSVVVLLDFVSKRSPSNAVESRKWLNPKVAMMVESHYLVLFKMK